LHPTISRNEILAKLGVEECDCIACVQKLTRADLKSEDKWKTVEMYISGVVTKEVGDVRDSMERIAQLFDILNIYTSPTSIERNCAKNIIDRVYKILADRLMFAA
jgi:hypothetical protein